MNYQKNDKVVYPGHGLSTISSIKEVNGKEVFVINISNGTTILLLTSRDDLLRSVISKDEAEGCLNTIHDGITTIDIDTTWNRRYRDYMELLKGGIFKDVVMVYKSLLKLRDCKDLSFGERKMIDHSKQLLEEELSFVLGKEINL